MLDSKYQLGEFVRVKRNKTAAKYFQNKMVETVLGLKKTDFDEIAETVFQIVNMNCNGKVLYICKDRNSHVITVPESLIEFVY